MGPPRAVSGTDSGLAARLAAVASLGAAVIHFAVAPAHWLQWMPAGLFFITLALFQLIWARLVIALTTIPVLAGGVVVNVGAVALWVMSRTIGKPLGSHAGAPEMVHAADLCALLLQLYIVMGAGWVWYRGLRGALLPAFANGAILVGASVVVALASMVGVASGLHAG